MFLAREEACMKVRDIAESFEVGKAAASTAVSRIKRQMQVDVQLRQKVINLKTHIQAHRTRVPAWIEAINL